MSVEAFVTPLDLPGKPEAGGPGQRHPARPALSQNAAPVLQAAVVAEPGVFAKQQSRFAAAELLQPSEHSSGTRRRQCRAGRQRGAMRSAAIRSGAVTLRHDRKRWRSAGAARRKQKHARVASRSVKVGTPP
jgi:hypothetical protein